MRPAMRAAIPLLTLVLGSAGLAACASVARPPLGRDFAQAAFAGFVLDQTSAAEVEAALGPPVKTGSMSGLAKPDSKIIAPGTRFTMTTLDYVFAPFGMAAPLPQHPIKLAILVFFDGRLMAYDVNSLIPGQMNPAIDEARLDELAQGRTTRAEAIALLGTPNAQAMHLVDSQPGTSEIGYNWFVPDGLGLKHRSLRVSFDTLGRLSSYAVIDGNFPMPAPSMPPTNQPSPDDVHRIPPGDLNRT